MIVRLKLLPTSFDSFGCATLHQHLCCFLIDDVVAVDAGSLATSTTPEQKRAIRNVVLTHAHIDHVAGLPLFIDDLFVSLQEPLEVYALVEVIDILETHIFNWKVYPRFSELKNQFGEVLKYRAFLTGKEFKVAHLTFKAIKVNHKVPSVGLIIRDGDSRIAITGDTASMSEFWDAVNSESKLNALLIECAFPNDLQELANNSYHLTPKLLEEELVKFRHTECPVYVINIKPMYYEKVLAELNQINSFKVRTLQIGKTYEF